MKKLVLLMLTVVLVFGLAACGGNNNNNNAANNAPSESPTATETPAGSEEAPVLVPEEGAKLLVWDSGDQKDFILEVAKAFEAEYGVPVEYAEVGADKSMAQMIIDGPAGVGADVFVAVHDRTGSGAQAGVIMPVDVHEEQLRNEMYETAINAVTHDGLLFGYPKSVEVTAVFYNKDLIESVPADWQGVIDFAKTFNDPASNKFAYMWEPGNTYWSYGFFGGYGAYVFGSDGTDASDIGLNNEGGVEAGAFFESLKEILPLQTSDITADIKKSLFQEGKLAMNVSGPWDIASMKEIVPNLGVAPYPNLPNGQPMMPFSGVKAYFVNANTQYPDAAKLFAAFASSAEMQKKAFEMSGLLPANAVVAEDPIITNDPIVSGFLAQFNNSVPMPSIPEMAQVWGPFDAALASMWNDQVDPKTALDNAVQQIKDAIASNQ